MNTIEATTPCTIPFQQVSGTNHKKVDPTERRKVYDNIHGFIYFSQPIWYFIDTPHFQRLRKIKQLGCLEYVFPGATHTRFEHSLGTAYLAQTFMKLLIQNNPLSYKNQDKQSAILTVTLAGLLHDLGHGPYSHTFDSYIVTEITKIKGQKPIQWKHEIASQQLFMNLVTVQGLGKYLNPNKKQVERIKALINGVPDGVRDWEFQIISNKENGIDVDKLDYFRRDAFHLGAKNIYVDHQLLMNQARIIGKDICYPSKYVEAVYNIFHCRYKLYKNYYFNLVSKGVQMMICDILKETRQKFKFRQICQQMFTDPTNYIKLTDNILEKVEYIYQNIQDNIKNKRQSEDNKYLNNFKKAVDIINNIKTRKIYRFVRQFHYFIQQGTDKRIIKIFDEQFKKDIIVKYVGLKAHIANIQDSICLSINDVGFGLKEANPLKRVGFFRKQLDKLKKLETQQILNLSMLYTNAYKEISIKIFIKQDSRQLFDKVDGAFKDYCNSVNTRCKDQLQKDGLDVIFSGRGGRTPFQASEENDKFVEGYSANKVEFEVICQDNNG